MGRKTAVLAAICAILVAARPAAADPEVALWFPSPWASRDAAAKRIAEELGRKSGLKVVPRIAESNPEILSALARREPALAYVGSMVAAVLWSRRLAQPLFQAIDGRHVYAGVMILPAGQSPEQTLREFPERVAFARGFTSGEACAKAATGGRAALGAPSFDAAADAVAAGRAKAAFVKDFWWDDAKRRYPGLVSVALPGISETRNPDNVMLVSETVAPEVRGLLMDAAYHAPELFEAAAVVPFDSSSLDFTISLMKKAGIDPLAYVWQE